MLDDKEVNTIGNKYIDEQSKRIRSDRNVSHMNTDMVDELCDQLAYYLALRNGEKINEQHRKDAILWASSMSPKVLPSASYYAIYHYTHNEIFPYMDIGIDFDIKKENDKPFNDNSRYFYLLSEACYNTSCANYIFSKGIKYTGVEKMIFDAFYRVWKINKLNYTVGYIMMFDIYNDKNIARCFINMSDTNKERGYNRVQKIIQEMHV